MDSLTLPPAASEADHIRAFTEPGKDVAHAVAVEIAHEQPIEAGMCSFLVSSPVAKKDGKRAADATHRNG